MSAASRAPRSQRHDHWSVLAFRGGGIACIVLAVTAVVLGLVIFLSGYEVAFLLLIVALGAFVLGIGLLAAGRRLS